MEKVFDMPTSYLKHYIFLATIGLSGCLNDTDTIISNDASLNDSCFSNKSVNSLKQVKLEFRNNFGGNLDVVWQDYEGDQVVYGTVPPNAVMAVTTYVSHPWSFIYSGTGNCLGYYNPKVGDDGKRIDMVKY